MRWPNRWSASYFRSHGRAVEQPIFFLKRSKMVNLGEIIHQLNCWYKTLKIFFFFFFKYSPTTFEIINIIKQLVWRILKIESIGCYCRHFAFSSIRQFFNYRLNKGSQVMVRQGGSTSYWHNRPFLHRLVVHLCIEWRLPVRKVWFLISVETRIVPASRAGRQQNPKIVG